MYCFLNSAVLIPAGFLVDQQVCGYGMLRRCARKEHHHHDPSSMVVRIVHISSSSRTIAALFRGFISFMARDRKISKSMYRIE